MRDPGLLSPSDSIAGRRYVDGGIHSPSNLDVVARTERLDVVICLNPTSTLDEGARFRRPVERLQAFMRSASGRRLGNEARMLREAGIEVVLCSRSLRTCR